MKKRKIFKYTSHSDYRIMLDIKTFTEINKSIIQLVYSDGRIIIPKPIRDLYNIQEGDTVEALIIGRYKNNGKKKNKKVDAP